MSAEMLKDLQALVECESPTEDLDACRRVIDLANSISERVVGSKAEIFDEKGRPVYWLGTRTPAVVLLAHLDTVWPIGSFSPLWSVEGDVVRGPGIYDMKAGFLQALFGRLSSGNVADALDWAWNRGSGRLGREIYSHARQRPQRQRHLSGADQWNDCTSRRHYLPDPGSGQRRLQ